MKKIIPLFLIVMIIFASAFGFLGCKEKTYKDKNSNSMINKKIKSGNLSTDYIIKDALNDIEKLDLNTVNVPIVININDLSSDDMNIDKASEEKAINLIKMLKNKNLNVILEPYPWIKNGTLYETDWAPNNIDNFFCNWKNKVIKPLIDDVANPYNVDALIIASNYQHMEYDVDNWCDIIDYTRKSYNGLITYKTNWWYTAKSDKNTITAYNKKLNNSMFSKVDFISIAAYFELTDHETNSVPKLTKAINSTEIYNRKQNIEQEIKNFYIKWKKPIYFGELGFPRRNGASISPWNPNPTNTPNNSEQANCFEAYRKVFENKPWFMGFSVFAIGEHSEDKHYYPSDEAAKVIKTWYTDSRQKDK